MNKNTKRFLSFALAGTVVAGVPVASAHAEDVNVEALEEAAVNTTTYVIKDGDTLGSICKRVYGNSGFWEALAEYNKLENPNELSIGQVIILPRDLNELLTFEVPTPVVENNEEVVVNDEFEPDKTYTVKSGDTLYCIVRVQYGLTNQEAVDKLATYNGLSDPNRISLGQKLLIPCIEKLNQVVQNDYTAEYNRMGWILNHPNGCKPCEVKPECVPVYVIPYCDPYLVPVVPCEPYYKPDCHPVVPCDPYLDYGHGHCHGPHLTLKK